MGNYEYIEGDETLEDLKKITDVLRKSIFDCAKEISDLIRVKFQNPEEPTKIDENIKISNKINNLAEALIQDSGALVEISERIKYIGENGDNK